MTLGRTFRAKASVWAAVAPFSILGVLEGLVRRGKTVLMSTHDLGVARYWADVVVVMSGGRIVAEDSPEAVFGNLALLKLICPPEPWEAGLYMDGRGHESAVVLVGPGRTAIGG